MIILDGGAGDANGPDHGAILSHERHSTREGDEPPIGDLDLVERPAWLRELTERPGREIEQASGAGFLDGDVDAAEPGAVHAGEGLEVGSGIDDGDIHQDTHVGGRRNRRLHDRLGLGQTDVLGGEGIRALGCRPLRTRCDEAGGEESRAADAEHQIATGGSRCGSDCRRSRLIVHAMVSNHSSSARDRAKLSCTLVAQPTAQCSLRKA